MFYQYPTLVFVHLSHKLKKYSFIVPIYYKYVER